MAVSAKQIRHLSVSPPTGAVEAGDFYHLDVSSDLALTLPPAPMDGEIVYLEAEEVGGVLTLTPAPAHSINGGTAGVPWVFDTATASVSQFSRGRLRFDGGDWTTIFKPFALTSLNDVEDSYADKTFFVPQIRADRSGVEFVPPSRLTWGWTHLFNAAIVGPPPASSLILNHANPMQATQIWVNELTASGIDVNDMQQSGWFDDDVLELRSLANPDQWAVFRLTATPVAVPGPPQSTQFSVVGLGRGDDFVAGDTLLMHIRNLGSTFIECADSPASYAGNARRVVAVADDEHGLHFQDPADLPRGNPYTFAAAEDTTVDPGPGNVRVNAAVIANATELSISALDADGNIDVQLPFLGAGDQIVIFDENINAHAWDVVAVTVTGTQPNVWYQISLGTEQAIGGAIARPGDVRVLGAKGNAGVATSFLSLLDTPNSYGGHANKHVRVNSLGNALEFDLLDAVPPTRQINTGTGLAGGGNLMQDRTHILAFQDLVASSHQTTGMFDMFAHTNAAGAHRSIRLSELSKAQNIRYGPWDVTVNVGTGAASFNGPTWTLPAGETWPHGTASNWLNVQKVGHSFEVKVLWTNGNAINFAAPWTNYNYQDRFNIGIERLSSTTFRVVLQDLRQHNYTRNYSIYALYTF